MKMLCLSVLLLLLTLQIKAEDTTFPNLVKSDGTVSANMSYFNERKKWLADMKITLHPRPANSKTDPRYYDTKLTYTPDYKILINEPNLCSQHDKVFLLIVMRTFYPHFQWRAYHRQILAHASRMSYRKDIVVKHVFIFAKSRDPAVEKLLRVESRMHRDLIQADFEESYLNLIKKVPFAWDWVVNYCPNAEYVMINNDEAIADIDKLIVFLLKDYTMGQNHNHFTVCYPMGGGRADHKDVPKIRNMNQSLVYQGLTMTPYCHGWSYVAHIVLINQLHKATFSSAPPFMPTDLYIGFLGEKLRVNFQRNQKKFYIIANIEKVLSNPRYPVEEGMIIITDHSNKNHELRIFKAVTRYFERHWSIKDNNSFKPFPLTNSEPVSVDCTHHFYLAILMGIALLLFFKICCGARCLGGYVKDKMSSNHRNRMK